jgi:ATP-binding cassette subfamily B (MDR/TAP) protein 1
MQIKTVKSLTAEEFNSNIYKEALELTTSLTLKFAIAVGFGLGIMMFSMFADHAFAFYLGGIFISNHYHNDITGQVYNMSDVFGCFISIMMGAQGLGQAAPSLKAITLGKEAGFRMF